MLFYLVEIRVGGDVLSIRLVMVHGSAEAIPMVQMALAVGIMCMGLHCLLYISVNLGYVRLGSWGRSPCSDPNALDDDTVRTWGRDNVATPYVARLSFGFAFLFFFDISEYMSGPHRGLLSRSPSAVVDAYGNGPEGDFVAFHRNSASSRENVDTRWDIGFANPREA